LIALNRYKSKNRSTKRQPKDKVKKIKHQTCYTCRDKGHISKDCTNTQASIPKVVNNNVPYVKGKNYIKTTKVISSPCTSPKAIWVTMKDPTRPRYQNMLNLVVGDLRCIGSLTINKKMESMSNCQA
jgi:hypothetical protein